MKSDGKGRGSIEPRPSAIFQRRAAELSGKGRREFTLIFIAQLCRNLGHPHCLVDTVHYGFQLGGKLGTPTINMRFAEGVLVPRHGVYAAKVFLDNGEEHMAVTNVGVRPTVSGSDRVSVESYILDFTGDLYDHTVRVEFHHFIRDEHRFSDVEELKAQILRDANTTREYFANA